MPILFIFISLAFSQNFLDENFGSKLIYKVNQDLKSPYIKEEIELGLIDILNLIELDNVNHTIRYKKINVQGKLIFQQVHSYLLGNHADILCKSLLKRSGYDWDLLKQTCYLDSSLVKRF